MEDESEQIWFPFIKFYNLEPTQDRSQRYLMHNVYRNLKISPKHVGPDNLRYSYRYLGSQHFIKKSQESTGSWKCAFNLRMYPFDMQVCEMVFELPSDIAEFVRLRPRKLKYEETANQLSEYLVDQISFCSRNKGEFLVVEVVLKRPLISSILTIFIPTLLLLVISHVSKVFAEDFLDMVIPVHLTVLLVLASL